MSDHWTARFLRAVSRRGGKAACALGDQAAVSLGNFVTNIVLARELTRMHGAAEYGVFTLLLEAMLLLNQLQTALVTYPLSVRGAVMPQDEMRRFATGCLLLTAIVLLPLSGVLFLTAGVVGHVELAIWATSAMALWQVHETFRRVLMSQLRYREAVISDTVSYIGQAAAVVLLAWMGHLTLKTAFMAMAVTSGIAICVQVFQVGPRLVAVRELGPMAASFWRLGRWMLFSSTIGVLATQTYLWSLMAFHGLEAVASFQALVNLVKVTNPLLFSICGLIVPLAARLRVEVGIGAARNVAVRYGLLGLALLAPYYAALLFAPHVVIGLAYGDATPYRELTTEMRLMVGAYGLMYVTGIIGALLNALERGRHTLVAQVINLSATLVIGIPLVAWAGLEGSLWAGLLTTSVLAGVLVYFMSRLK